jgi:hypothetical protein
MGALILFFFSYGILCMNIFCYENAEVECQHQDSGTSTLQKAFL